jgi:GMP synthase-like glutamine amidotransferase
MVMSRRVRRVNRVPVSGDPAHSPSDTLRLHMRVDLVITEHPSFLDVERAAGYEEIRGLLAALAGRPVDAVHYLDARSLGPGPVVLSGAKAPWSAHDPVMLERLGDRVRAARAPVLGICAGMQLLARFAGGRIETMVPPEREELGYGPLDVLDASDLLAELPARATVFHDHRDEITSVPRGFRVLASTSACGVQAVAVPERRWWGTQFHPECFDDEHPDGERVLRNFFELAGS